MPSEASTFRSDQSVEELTLELAEVREQQTATAAILAAISNSPIDSYQVFAEIAASAARLCEAYDAVIFQVDGAVLRLVAHEGPVSLGPVGQFTVPLVRGSLTGRVALERRIIQLADHQAEEVEYPEGTAVARQVGVHTMLAVPLLRSGEAIGVIGLRRTVVRLFTDRQIELLKTFANQAVVAIENTRLFEAEQARTRELTEALEQQIATSNVLEIISSSTGELQRVFEALLENATRLSQANFGNLFLREGSDYFRLVATHNAPPQWAAWWQRVPVVRPHPRSPLGRCLNKEIVHVVDLASEQPYIDRDPTFVALVDLAGARAIVSVPMLKEGEVIGVIAIYSQELRPFTAKQIELFKSFASQAVIGIENTRLLNELRESLQQQTATADVLKSISRSAFDLQSILDALVRSAADLCSGADVSIQRLVGDNFHIAAHCGPIPTPANRVLTVAGTAQGRCVTELRPVHVADMVAEVEAFPISHALTIETGVRTMLCVPLIQSGAAIGVIVLRRAEVRLFSDKQVELVSTFANQAVIAIENTRLFEAEQASKRELQEALEYQTATSEVLGVISRSPTELQPVLDVIVQTASRLAHAHFAHVFIERDSKFHLVATNQEDHDTVRHVRANPIAPSQRGSILARAIARCATVHVPDTQSDPEAEGGLISIGAIRSSLAVPLLRAGRAVGGIVLTRNVLQAYTDREIRLVETFADQAVIAMNNARLFEEVQARNRDLRAALEQQTATSELLKVIGRSTFELQPVFDTLAENAVRLCAAERAFVHRFDGQFLSVAATYNVSPELRAFIERNPMAPGRYGVAARAALERRTVHIRDVQAEREITFAARDIEPVRTALSVPMLRSGELLGVIMIYRHDVSPFTDSQVALIETFADQAAIAIENTRLLEELQVSNRDLTALGEVGRVVSSTLDLRTVLKTIVDRAVVLSGTDGGSIFYFREDIGRFELGETTGLDEETVARFRKLDIATGQTGLGEAIARRQPLQLPDIHSRPRNPLRDAALEAGLRAALIVPLLSGDAPLGALVLQRRHSGEFPGAVVTLMQAFADQSVIALENARLFEEIAQKSRELEIASQHKSQFVANMSHELRTPLAAILGYAELIQEGFYGPQPEKSMDALTRIRSNGKHLLGLINTVLDIAKIESGQFTLNMSEYAIESVVETVRSATESLAQNKKLALNTQVAKSLPIGLGDEQRLTQVLLNLVGNAIKFTDAGEVRVTAKVVNGRFSVSVTDTGPGIPEEHQVRIFEQFHQVDSSNTKAKGGTGLGLAIAKQIVEMHGGRIWVESTVGKGSTFQMEIPARAEVARSG